MTNQRNVRGKEEKLDVGNGCKKQEIKKSLVEQRVEKRRQEGKDADGGPLKVLCDPREEN